MIKNTKVTVAITCYNYGEYVAEAIESIIHQTYENINLIIIDDGSTDNSIEVINRYRDNNNVEIISRKNKGIVYTRNEALERAKGDFLCFLDADDYFDADYIEKMVRVAQDNDADVVYPNWHIFGEEKYSMTFPEFNLQSLIIQNIHCSSASLLRLSAVGDHKFESELVAEDWDFFVGLALDGRRFESAKDCYINYRVRKGTRGAKRSYWDDMYHFYAILQKWSKRYPGRINPLDLPIHAGRIKDEHLEAQRKIIHDRDALISVNNKEIDRLRERLDLVYRSKTYRIGNAILSPLKLLGSRLRSR